MKRPDMIPRDFSKCSCGSPKVEALHLGIQREADSLTAQSARVRCGDCGKEWTSKNSQIVKLAKIQLAERSHA